MADLNNIEKSRIVIEGPDGTDLNINDNNTITTLSHPELLARNGNFFSTVDAHTFSGTTFENKILLRNPTGSGKNVYFFKLKHVIDLSSSIATLHDLFVVIYRNPTVTANGGVLQTRNVKSGQSDTSVLLVNQNPTISSVGTLITGDMTSNAEPSTLNHLILEPGDTYLISLAVSNSSDGAYSIINWGEEDV